MSHFAVLVAGKDPEALLAPFHEFECTGQDDEYVKDIDITESARSEFDQAKKLVIKAPDGTVKCAYDDCFYRDPSPEETKEIGRIAGTGGNGRIQWASKDWYDSKGYRTKIHFIPEGCEEQMVQEEDFKAWLADYYGYKPVDSQAAPDLKEAHKYGYFVVQGDIVLKVVDRTNPNKKWDWYQIGGRWAGGLKLKPGTKGLYGERGVAASCSNDAEGYASQCLKGDIDVEGMREEAARKAGEKWEIARGFTAGKTWKSFDEVKAESGSIDVAREVYWAQPGLEEMSKAFGPFHDLEQYTEPKDVLVDKARRSAVSFFAFLDARGWEESGEMPMFASVKDEQDKASWVDKFNAWFDALSDDTVITLVDCHI